MKPVSDVLEVDGRCEITWNTFRLQFNLEMRFLAARCIPNVYLRFKNEDATGDGFLVGTPNLDSEVVSGLEVCRSDNQEVTQAGPRSSLKFPRF